jgi:tRNA pseudouridine38-40 synthase
MPRYFLSVGYLGTKYAGSQVQENGLTIQGELERALSVVRRQSIALTGSSRTDAGVHARRNFYHFDMDEPLVGDLVYQMNAVLPSAIAVLDFIPVNEEAHCRFDAIGRKYVYRIHTFKDPFMHDRGWFYPYPMDLALLNEAALLIEGEHDFTSFAKRNSQVHTHNCTIMQANWVKEDGVYTFSIQGNRFLRGMVRGLVATMVKVGRGKISVPEFHQILQSKDCTQADFSAPPQGLVLEDVIYPVGILQKD